MRSFYVALLMCWGCSILNARTTQDFNAEWRFLKDPQANIDASATSFDDAAWQRVRLPHDWAISGPFDPKAGGGTGKLPWSGVGWYRKTFTLPATAAGQNVYFDFQGVMANPEVFVNGQRAGSWDYGYLGFRVDATRLIRAGQPNSIAVRADTRFHHSRWYPGAGIYRKVILTLCDPVQVAHDATFITTPEVNNAQAIVQVVSAVTNATAQTLTAQVTVTLLGSDGKSVAEQRNTLALPSGAAVGFTQRFILATPQLWELAQPNLYQARIHVTAERFTDVETTRFGIRSFAFLPNDGFHLNGRRVQLKGVNLHADLGPLGMAFNQSAMRRELERLQDMGVNALRTSHNCPAPGVLDLCDEMGIFVWDEAFDKWDGTAGRKKDQNLETYIARNLKQFALRDRNHPCVFVWSIGNEIASTQGEGSSPDGTSFARCTFFRDTIRSVDTTRPVGIGCCHGQAIGNGDFAALDITGWNYQGQYANMYRAYPNKPVLYSESASTVSSYGYYAPVLPSNKMDYAIADFEVDSYDYNSAPWSDIPDKEFERMERDTYCGGEFVWTGFDYLGEPYPYMQYLALKDFPQEKLARSAYFGIVDLMGVPKDRFYLYRSHWNKTATTLHILPHWTWPDRVGQTIPVYVYTSGDSAELFLNGKSLGRRMKGQSQPKPINFAAGKVATASTVETANHTNLAANALDGKHDTRWCASSDASPQWWQVDLGNRTAFRFLAVAFENDPKGYGFEILISDDGVTWHPHFIKKLGDSAPMTIDKPAMGRYVRVMFTDLNKGRWASIREVTLSDQQMDNSYYDICDTYRLRWLKVAYEPGELKAVAYEKGKKIAEQVIRTAGPAVAVRLTPEHAVVPADGESVVFVQVDVVDAQETCDPLATQRISFALEGPGELVAVGNGNARGLDSFTEVASHPLYFGKAMAVVRREAGTTDVIKLTASAEGLKPACAILK